jgi:hypothetical protein
MSLIGTRGWTTFTAVKLAIASRRPLPLKPSVPRSIHLQRRPISSLQGDQEHQMDDTCPVRAYGEHDHDAACWILVEWHGAAVLEPGWLEPSPAGGVGFGPQPGMGDLAPSPDSEGDFGPGVGLPTEARGSEAGPRPGPVSLRGWTLPPAGPGGPGALSAAVLPPRRGDGGPCLLCLIREYQEPRSGMGAP